MASAEFPSPADVEDDELEIRAGNRGSLAELEALRELIGPDPEAYEAAGLPSPLPPAHVVAVIVSHDGAAWLPDALAAVAAQTRRPDQVLGADTGSTDASLGLLREALGVSSVRTAARTAGFGAAVSDALAHRPNGKKPPPGLTEWIWLLHDDCAPAPTALEELLRAAGETRGADLLGPKVLDWDDPRHLVEVGLTVDRGGRRVTGLDAQEFDQGQYDGARDVLAVGTAGALVRAEVWQRLGGLDPRLPLFRDDLDLGWRVTLAGGRVRVVTRAEVRHARAAATGRRHADAAPGVARRVDRGHALLVLLANCGPLALIGALPRAVVAGLLRSLGYLITRRPHLATDELVAVGSVLRPDRLIAARAWRRSHVGAEAEGGQQAVRALLAPRGARLKSAIGVAGDVITGGSVKASGPAPGSSIGGVGATETGPVSEESEELLPADDIGRLRRLLLRPVLVLTAALTVLALIADRHLLSGGQLLGGRLLPVPESAVDLWRGYAATWHGGAAGGSPTVSAPWTPWLAAPATLFGGSVGFTIGVLVLFATPLSGVSAWIALRRLDVPAPARVWAAATYAAVPVVTGSVAAGRFDTLVAAIAMPLLVRATARLIARSRRQSATRSAWALGLGLAGVSAFTPQVWTFAAVVLVGAALFRLATGALRAFLRLLIPLLTVPLLALPWLPRLAADPGVLLTGLGRPGGLAGQPAALTPTGRSLLSFSPSGHGLLSSPPPAWLLIPVVLAAVTGLLSSDRRLRLPATACWGAILLGWVAAVLASKQELPGAGDTQRGFGGPALALAAAATVIAAAMSSIGLRERLSSSSFGRRQIAAALLVVLSVPVPVALALRWTIEGAAPISSATTAGSRGVQAGQPGGAEAAGASTTAAASTAGAGSATVSAGGQLRRTAIAALPADVFADAAAGGAGQRALFLRRERDGSVDYTLDGLRGPHLGDEEQVGDPTTVALLTALVRDLATPRGTDAAELLSTFDVRVVAVLGAGRSRLTDALDAQPALTRRATGGYDGTLYELTVPTARLQVLAPPLAAVATHPAGLDAGVGRGPSRAALVATPPTALAAGPEGAVARVAAGPPGRLLVVSDSFDAGWQATLDGHRLTPTRAWGWAQAFTLPAAGGSLRLTRDSSTRDRLLVLQGIALFLVLLLAAPALGRDRRGDDGVEDSGAPEDEVEEPAHPLHVPATIERLRAGRLA